MAEREKPQKEGEIKKKGEVPVTHAAEIGGETVAERSERPSEQRLEERRREREEEEAESARRSREGSPKR